MRRGTWHQCGDRSQRLVKEELQNGIGVGVVISPRDLAFPNAVGYSNDYRDLGAAVLIDQQFHIPAAAVGRLDTYPSFEQRNTISQLQKVGDAELSDLARALETINRDIGADAIVAPAVVYEAGRPEILALNVRLFRAARAVGNALGKPTYATVVVGGSAAATPATISAALSHATSLDADGWYYAFEFAPERIPSSRDDVLRCCIGGLTLACTGKPVLHAYAGPLGLLSPGFGATGVGIGHSQNLWRFDRNRWDTPDEQGGGGAAPARYFSSALWGTIVHPDETAQLDAAVREQVLTPSPFTGGWNRWEANKHLVYVLGRTISEIAADSDPRSNAAAAATILTDAVALHTNIAGRVALRDNTGAYQANWRLVIEDLLRNQQADYDYLDLLE
jgi:hypothetical protein